MLCPDLEKEEKQCIENLQKDKMKPKLELTIMASTACNFRCEYCYEELMPKTIDSEFSSVFIKYIEKMLNILKVYLLIGLGVNLY